MECKETIPGDKIKMSGLAAVDPSKISLRSKPPLDRNLSPISSLTKALTEATRLSGLSTLISRSLSMGLRTSQLKGLPPVKVGPGGGSGGD